MLSVLGGEEKRGQREGAEIKKKNEEGREGEMEGCWGGGEGKREKGRKGGGERKGKGEQSGERREIRRRERKR